MIISEWAILDYTIRNNDNSLISLKVQIEQKGIMIRNLRNKYLFGIFFLDISNSVYCQIRNKIDTIQNNNCRIIIEYPAYNRINITNYEEGYFKTINCIQDTAFITIFDGRMVNLPIIDLSDKTIESESFLSKSVLSLIHI